jgi:predicted DNA binding CopG/RHH family protein
VKIFDEQAKIDLAARKEPKLPVTFRLEKDLIRRLKDAAARHGIRYQSLAREILWRSLSRPRRRAE